MKFYQWGSVYHIDGCFGDSQVDPVQPLHQGIGIDQPVQNTEQDAVDRTDHDSSFYFSPPKGE